MIQVYCFKDFRLYTGGDIVPQYYFVTGEWYSISILKWKNIVNIQMGNLSTSPFPMVEISYDDFTSHFADKKTLRKMKLKQLKKKSYL